MTFNDLEQPKGSLAGKKSFYGAHQKYWNEDRPILKGTIYVNDSSF